MITIVVETFDGARVYIQEGDTLVTDSGHTLTYTDLNALIVEGALAEYGLKVVSPVKSNDNGSRKSISKMSGHLPFLAATFLKG